MSTCQLLASLVTTHNCTPLSLELSIKSFQYASSGLRHPLALQVAVSYDSWHWSRIATPIQPIKAELAGESSTMGKRTGTPPIHTVRYALNKRPKTWPSNKVGRPLKRKGWLTLKLFSILWGWYSWERYCGAWSRGHLWAIALRPDFRTPKFWMWRDYGVWAPEGLWKVTKVSVCACPSSRRADLLRIHDASNLLQRVSRRTRGGRGG